MTTMPEKTMPGVVLPGNSTVEIREYPVPTPGHGQVLVQMKASSICGSDIRAIYREHLGVGDEAYRGVIAGHEPCGQIVEVGPGCKEFQVGRPGGAVPHQRLRRLRGLQGRLHDLLPLQAPRRLRLAARRRPRPVPAGGGEHLHPPAGQPDLRGRGAGGLRLRHGLGGADAHQGQRAGQAAGDRPGAGGAGGGDAGQGAGGAPGDRRGHEPGPD